jgi:hypothetical protein
MKSIKFRVEKILDKITPIVEISSELLIRLDSEKLEQLMSKARSEFDLKIISKSVNSYTLLWRGSFGITSEYDGVFYKNATSVKRLEKLKSKIEIHLEENKLNFSSFEHIVALKKDREVFKNILEKRLEKIVDLIEKEVNKV